MVPAPAPLGSAHGFNPDSVLLRLKDFECDVKLELKGLRNGIGLAGEGCQCPSLALTAAYVKRVTTGNCW